MLSHCATPFAPRAVPPQAIVQLNLDMHAHTVLLQHPELICWDIMPYNRGNYPIYARYPGMISWTALKHNPMLYQLMRQEISQIDWKV
jgi:hypothetical protein